MTGYASLPDLISALGGQVIRNTTRWVFNSAGVLVPVAPNQIAFDHDPVTLARRGIPFEPARTNGIRNGSFSGGTPGSLGGGGAAPSNMLYVPNSGIDCQFLGVGTEFGMPFMDLRFTGTTNGTTVAAFHFENTTALAASVGQAWSISFFHRLVAGAFPASFTMLARFSEQSPSYLNKRVGAVAAPTAALQRAFMSNTVQEATATSIRPAFEISPAATGVVVDFTLRVYAPQATPGTFATSPILTNGTALTRDADILALPFPGIWGRQNEGTLLLDVVPFANISDANIAALFDGAQFSVAGGFRLRQGASDPAVMQMLQRDGTGADQGTLSGGSFAAGASRRVAFAFRRNDTALVVNGGAATVDNTVELSANMLQLRIGLLGVAPAMHLRRLIFWPTRLPNAQLQTLTA